MKRLAATLIPAALLAGCASTGTVSPPVVRRTIAPAYTSAGLERVIGSDAAALVVLLGTPQLDVREGTARKLQFGSGICVLDAYLYPKDGATPRVTYVDARQPDGSAIDRASCVAALTRKGGGK